MSHASDTIDAPLRLGIAGLGTVGAGVVRLLHAHADMLTHRAGRPLQVTAVSARDPGRERNLPLAGIAWEADPRALAAREDVDVVVELIGGAEGPARELATAALSRGKGLVTANKALIAHHGRDLAALAEAHDAPLLFEAAVAGGIPVIEALRTGLAANRLSMVAGILNGTCNYILSAMAAQGRDFADVLAEAQALGYAEADPAFDVDGTDTAHKLAILASLAFGIAPSPETVQTEGIRAITAADLAYAATLGRTIKLLGIARAVPAHASAPGGGVALHVHPAMVPVSCPLGRVDGVLNAVTIRGEPVGITTLEGPGAGAGPTASSVVADILALARGGNSRALRHPFHVPAAQLLPPQVPDPAESVSAFYVRLQVADQPGVLADITAIFRDQRISVESILQRTPQRLSGAVSTVAVALTTHPTAERAMAEAARALAALPTVTAPPFRVRMVDF